VTPARRWPIWPALLLAALGLAALYAEPLRTRFLNDDYTFLEEARTRPLPGTLTGTGALGNYYRPFSRQIYFALLSPIAGGHPLVFHLANFALFLTALALLVDLLLVFLPPAGAMAGCLYLAVLPLQRVNLTWVSCSQDLLALTASLAALALFRRGKTAWALFAYAAAVASKEAALPLPLAFAAWEMGVRGSSPRRAGARVAPFVLIGIAWGWLAIAMRTRNAPLPALRVDPEHFLAGYAHMIQSLLGLEHPAGMPRSLLRSPPPILPLFLLAALAFWYAPRGPQAEAGVPPRPLRATAGFAVLWLAAFGVVTGPVVETWSAYYYTLAAVGGSLLIGLAFSRGDRWMWVGLSAFLLWWHAGSNNTRAFAVTDGPWGWTSHLNSSYFRRASALTDTLSRQLRALEPAPPRDTRFFFATLPPWAGFQMGNGALVRALYRDRSLGSFFYSQFSESTAAGWPCRFIYWDGMELRQLYANARDPFFQVGSDLLLLDRPAGAAHAFRRGLAAGGERMDLLYWLGWTEFALGHRGAAEAAWTAFGAHDDSLYWIAHLRAARNSLVEDRDTLEARRHLVKAIEFGIGRPEAHAVLGQLLLDARPKYAMLELKAAAWLKPRDWMVRRDLFIGLVRARLDDPARREFDALAAIYPEWRTDSLIVQAHRGLERRSPAGRGVVEF
jgi:tetratricopeptide (TPR) repeat protein